MLSGFELYPRWGPCVQYRKQNHKENAIDWKMSDQQAKLLAQVAIQYDAHGTVKLSNLFNDVPYPDPRK